MTNIQTPLKTFTLLRYATTMGNQTKQSTFKQMLKIFLDIRPSWKLSLKPNFKPSLELKF